MLSNDKSCEINFDPPPPLPPRSERQLKVVFPFSEHDSCHKGHCSPIFNPKVYIAVFCHYEFWKKSAILFAENLGGEGDQKPFGTFLKFIRFGIAFRP